MLTVECGEHKRTFDADDGLPLNELLDWFDEPPRQAEREAADRARVGRQKAASVAFYARVIEPIGDALDQVEADGYRNDGEWHDRVMDQLGVGDVRYGA